MKESEMATIADYIVTTLKGRNDPAVVTDVRAKVAALCSAFPAYR
jgi:glycine/serine hydroxymethyltransferase